MFLQTLGDPLAAVLGQAGFVPGSFGVRRKLVFKSDISKSSACFSDMMSRNPGFFE